mmetsp:Transcript_50035/g.50394  ORF Transcript_50035/g.50394 Transcript_50035/m.50394 type:complete len:99 (+) Transcript_50035:362-658(+)|eukprot:CAMPEP_0171313600 /NCGR_PEP_ID=MMETSP0816-20121228/44101_1 /TAXON_ID=420281 /ORGANISM="Proboscia inermis, Strain CCAP1064/1" /LENGTH=98 /DNA_ID=CAMNT_0011801239 /DNA_START=197 /DNA_END=493 /DNA_ORIENTATION=+
MPQGYEFQKQWEGLDLLRYDARESSTFGGWKHAIFDDVLGLVDMVGLRSMGNVDLLSVFVLLVMSVTIDAEEALRNVLVNVTVNIRVQDRGITQRDDC